EHLHAIAGIANLE
ncbi:hypothetical protein D044_0445B, partial [Vibrio parahaemolyticus EKP-026]